MSMIVYPASDCPQGSAEWFRARAGVITASMVETIRAKVNGLDERQAAYVAALKGGMDEKAALAAAGYKNKPTAASIERAMQGLPVGEWSDAAKNYAFKLAIERITGVPLGDDEFNPWQAVRGSKLEEEARMEHEIAADVLVEQVGFVTTDDSKFGASADGWIGDEGGAEYKCYLAPSKLRPVLLDGDTKFVYAQCQMNMALTGRKWWDFGLYLPDLRPIGRHFTLIEIDRDDNYIDEMWKDLWEFDQLVESYKARLIAGGPGAVAQAADHLESTPDAPAPAPVAAAPAPAPAPVVVHVKPGEVAELPF